MRLLKFGEVTLPELNGNDELSQSARTNLIPLKYGAIDLDNSETVLNYKQISRTATINTDFDDTIDDLGNEAAKGARVLTALMRDDSTQRQLLAKMSMFSRGARATNYTCEQEFGLQWNSTYPYWLLSSHEPIYSDHGYMSDAGLFSDGNYQTVSITGTTVNFTVTNASGIRIPKVHFTIETDNSAFNGNIQNPKILNNTNKHYVKVNRNILAVSHTNDRIDIDCLSKKVWGAYESSSTVIAEYNLYYCLETNPDKLDWMILEPGANSFTFTADTVGVGTKTLYVHWSSHFI